MYHHIVYERLSKLMWYLSKTVTYRKILKISPSKHKPRKLVFAKKPLLNHPSKYKPPPPSHLRGLYLEIGLKYKVKQSKNGKFRSATIRLAQSILKRKFPFVDKPLKKGLWKI